MSKLRKETSDKLVELKKHRSKMLGDMEHEAFMEEFSSLKRNFDTYFEGKFSRENLTKKEMRRLYAVLAESFKTMEYLCVQMRTTLKYFENINLSYASEIDDNEAERF